MNYHYQQMSKMSKAQKIIVSLLLLAAYLVHPIHNALHIGCSHQAQTTQKCTFKKTTIKQAPESHQHACLLCQNVSESLEPIHSESESVSLAVRPLLIVKGIKEYYGQSIDLSFSQRGPPLS